MIQAAGPSHPLALAKANLPGPGRSHIQLVLTDRSSLTAGREVAVMSSTTWRLADPAAKYMLMKAGIGWGYMSEPSIREDLATGKLVHLDMPDAVIGDYAPHVIYRSDTPPGPAATWLIERFRSQA